MSKEVPTAPGWVGRIPKWKLAQIYEDDSQGMHDEALINDVAYTLLARWKSMLVGEEARSGRAQCPICDFIIPHEAEKGCLLVCKNCEWTGTWDAYRRSKSKGK